MLISGNFDQDQTKNQTYLKEKFDIRPWSAKADHSGRTAFVLNLSQGPQIIEARERWLYHLSQNTLLSS